jgi:GT2 family glycosyltransferase
MSIGIVLNTYKRKNYFNDQLRAVHRQTVRPDKIIVNRNDGWEDVFFAGVDWVKSKKNVGVYRRFCLGLDLDTDYLLFFDDDTIPGPEFLETLLKEHEAERGLYCAAGFTLNHLNYEDRKVFGWAAPERTRQKVRLDWPGHAWFMHKSILIESYNIPRYVSNLCGEDMRLAFAAQRLSLNSYAAPYNESSSNWGSLKGKNGVDAHATFRLPNQKNNMHSAMTFYRSLGWKFMSEQ